MNTTNPTHLITRAQDSRQPLVTRQELDELWQLATAAMHAGTLREAYGATEGLLCQAYRDNVVADALPDPRLTELGKRFPGELLQSLVDRVESVNWAVTRRVSA